MASNVEWTLLIAATIMNGLLAGASLDKALVQLPARRKIGLRAMADYHRATDLGPGLFLYPTLGLGAPILTMASAVALVLGRDASEATMIWIAAAGVLSAGHVITTARAAPNLLRLRNGASDEDLEELYRRFARWSNVRAFLQGLTFVVVVVAMASAL
jgi:hypothetical protein